MPSQQQAGPAPIVWQIGHAQTPAGPIVQAVLTAGALQQTVMMPAADMARFGADLCKAARAAATGLIVPAVVVPPLNGHHPAGG